MLHIGQSVYNIFQLVLVGIAEFLSDFIHKNWGLFQAYLQKDFELNLGEKHQGIDSYISLIFLPLI